MNRVNVLVAGPDDTKPERDAVLEVANRLNNRSDHASIAVIRFEESSVPSAGGHPQEILNEDLIPKSDLLVAAFWSKLGTPTKTELSGSVEEVHRFIELKGGARVMIYFGNRPLQPMDTDAKELARLEEFRKSIRERALYYEFESTDAFKALLFDHLGTKVNALLSGQLPVPGGPPPSPDLPTATHPDPRMRQLHEWGPSLKDIHAGFTARLVEFDKNPNDGYLELRAHIYTSAAWSLDRYLARAPSWMSREDRVFISGLSEQLKTLAGGYLGGLKDIPEYSLAGRRIARSLEVHVDHMSRLGASGLGAGGPVPEAQRKI